MFPTNDWLKDLDLTLNPYRKPPKPEVRDVKPPLAQQFTTQPVPPVIRPTPDSYPIVRPPSERPVRDSSFVASTPTPRSTPVSVPHFATYTPTPVSTPRSVPHTLTPAPHFPTYTPAPVPTTHSVTPTPAPTPHFAIPPPYVPPATRYVAPVVRPIPAYCFSHNSTNYP